MLSRGRDITSGVHLMESNKPVVKDGKVISTPDRDATAVCDRCGRSFPAKYAYCVCRG